MKKTVSSLLAVSALGAGMMATPAFAEDLAVVGSWSSLPLNKQFETPFWTEELPAASNGEINVQMTTHDQMGIGGGDVFRILNDGVFDVGMTVADYAVGDAPELEGLDVPLVANTAEEAQAMVEAARPMVEDIFKERFNSKVLAIAPYPPQVVFCKGDVTSLEDLKGKKVRGSGRMTTKFLEALGANGVNVAFSEVPGALERGVIDCAVTGAGSGYSAGWWEVSDHLMTIPLGGWDPVVTAMNFDKWNSLSPEMQKLITDEVNSKFEAPAWAAAAGALEADIACLTGNGTCPAGDPASMTLVEASDADLAKAKEILTTVVLPEWAERAGADWVKRWNDTVGKTVGVAVPLS
ncbi:TRAP-type C4-dicarboxylate transport system substrate-binding protein [Thalassospira sp. MBR-102]|uniref:C4-dicarboxylate ABC transporter substrate-binding protein n=1 Tax=Thalassospira xiamenensis TaxID=220697 RepID=A0ABR5Y6A1_9PROT|nr:TRAP transporter substrate-binding protein [Thalassospira xiamenensis]KZD05775.1 C4-dicarboxylate ABC transporter substrate-binding protein [Thalassospira xiamenensis]KZD09536.1 C4-dicarboxylate ABC transporter substrate-binding protein [Thalassospira xiamenensis]MCD1595150.1 TRAP transporter substrate-binding protein [Thalassospira xiamenensis]RCK42426.1 C4-dicarboxylate ABC transporter substrate-binding protein [Thalassospira xiamenensis]